MKHDSLKTRLPCWFCLSSQLTQTRLSFSFLSPNCFISVLTRRFPSTVARRSSVLSSWYLNTVFILAFRFLRKLSLWNEPLYITAVSCCLLSFVRYASSLMCLTRSALIRSLQFSLNWLMTEDMTSFISFLCWFSCKAVWSLLFFWGLSCPPV